MLEPILKGLVQWLYDMMTEIMAYASGELLGVMSMDLKYFEKTAPVISDIVNIFVALGWALLLGNLVFQLTKSIISGIGFESEDPKIIFLRTFVFAFLLLASRQICEIGLTITGTVIDLLKLPSSIAITTPDESMFSLGSGAKWLLVIIVGVILMIQMVKLLFEIGERYVITSVLTFFAPLAFAMGGSKNTNDIFKGWCRMYGSMMVMMMMGIVFLKLIMSAMSQMSSGNVLIWLVFVVALTRVARKIDSHIGKIGLNPAQTGNGIGSRIPGAMTMVALRVMTSAIGKSIAANKGTSSSGNHDDTRRRSSGSAPKNNSRNFADNRYSGGTNENTYTEASNSKSVNDNKIGGASSHSSSSAKQAMRNSNIQSQNGVFTAKQNQSSINSQNQANMRGMQTTHNPPLNRSTGTGNGSIPNLGTFDSTKTGANIQGGSAKEVKKTMSEVNPQIRVGRGISGSTITPGNMPSGNTSKEPGSQSGKTTFDNSSATVNSRTDSKKTLNQGGSNAAVYSQNQVSGSNSFGRDMLQGSEKTSATHKENTIGMRETSTKEYESSHYADKKLQSTEYTRRDESIEKRINHAYKHGRYNPSAENKKAKQSYFAKQSKDNLQEKRSRDVRQNRNRNGGDNNRKRKREK